MAAIDPKETCQSCVFLDGGRCRVYPQEPLPEPRAATCNELRVPRGGEAAGAVEPPGPGVGVYDLRQEGGRTVARLRRPRRRRDEALGAFLGRLGGVLRSPARLGGTEVAAEWLLAEGPEAWGELRATLLTARHSAGRVAALLALEELDDLRLPALLRRLLLEPERDEAVLAEAGRALARRGDPLASELLAAVGLPAGEAAREAARRAGLYLRPDWEGLTGLGEWRATVLSRWRRNRAGGALLGALCAVERDAPLLAALREAQELALLGRHDARTLARVVFRRGAGPPAGSDAVAAVMIAPWAVRLALPELLSRLEAAAGQAEAPPGRRAAPLAAAHILRGVVAREAAAYPADLLARTAEVVHPLQADLAGALLRGGPGPGVRGPRLGNTAFALAAGLHPEPGLLELEPEAPPALRACACLVHGAWLGAGVWPLEALDALPDEQRALARGLASEAPP